MATTGAAITLQLGLHQVGVLFVIGLDYQPDDVAVLALAIFFNANASSKFSPIEVSEAANLSSALCLG
jgi:hypothetical protein